MLACHMSSDDTLDLSDIMLRKRHSLDQDELSRLTFGCTDCASQSWTDPGARSYAVDVRKCSKLHSP